MKDYAEYVETVTRCMIAFQHIEEALKQVLVRFESLTYFRLKDYTHYDMRPKLQSINNAAMGRLIDMLAVYTDDKSFIADLRKIKTQRDEVAHKSLIMTVEEMNDKAVTESKASELQDIKAFAEGALTKICERYGDLDKTLNKIAAKQESEM